MSKPNEPNLQAKAESVDNTRRRLLGMVKYVPPVVLGVISLQQAGCQPGPSCMPTPCNPNGGPCVPNGGPCNPNNNAPDPNADTGTGTEADPMSGAAAVERTPGS